MENVAKRPRVFHSISRQCRRSASIGENLRFAGFLQPVEFRSKAFTESQSRLAAHDRECLAVLFALKTFRHFLQCRNFEVQTDNSALSQILTSRDMSDLYTRWYWKLAAFPGMKLVYRAGSKLYCADALSRRPVAPENILEPF